MNQVSQILLVIFAAFAFTACAGSGSISTNPADIQGEWELVSIEGSEIQATSDEGAYTLSFNADSTIAGRADCNYYAGKYTASESEDSGMLNLQDVSTTKVNCGENSQYDKFIKSVMNANSFQVEGGTQLVLSGGEANKVVFNRVEPEEES